MYTSRYTRVKSILWNIVKKRKKETYDSSNDLRVRKQKTKRKKKRIEKKKERKEIFYNFTTYAYAEIQKTHKTFSEISETLDERILFRFSRIKSK